MTISPFLVLRVHRVGSCFAIAELEYAAHQQCASLDAERRLMGELAQVLSLSRALKDRHRDQFVAMRDCRTIFLERQLQATHETIKEVLALGPIKGTESIPWNASDVRLRTLDELFPGFCLPPREGMAL